MNGGPADVAVTIECSGNSGDPRIMNGLVSNAVWTGVSLSAILQECEIQPTAREVVFLGMDTEQEPKFEAGNANYSSPHGWSIFVQDAQAPGNLLAFAMNGKPLAPEHGFPLRLILPGWYGMAQVKWLSASKSPTAVMKAATWRAITRACGRRNSVRRRFGWTPPFPETISNRWSPG